MAYTLKNMPVKNSLVNVLFILIVILLVFFQIHSIGDFQLDDTYITFSFSKNLAEGNGPVYSHGLRVEGYSNFLWMLLLSLPIRIMPHIDLYFLSRMMMAPFVFLLFWSTFRLSQSLTSRFFSLAVILLLALSSDIFTAAVVGLETIPYTALLTTAFYFYCKNPKDYRVTPMMMIAALTRIDGFIPLLLLCGFELTRSLIAKDFKWRDFIRWAAPGLLAYSVWFSWRWWYYGLLFPTTYYAKSHIHEALPSRGYEYAWGAFKSCAGWALLPLSLLFIIKKTNYKTLWLVFFIFMHIIYAIHVGGDWMPFERFFIPLFPIIFALFVSGLSEVNQTVKNLHLTYKTSAVVLSLSVYLIVGIWIARFSVNTTEEREKIALIEDQKIHVQANLIPASKFFSWIIRPREKLVSDFAGAFAIFTQAQVLDMWGLCNKEVALRGNTNGINPIYGLTCPSCLAEQQPDFFLTMTWPKPSTSFKNHASVVANVWQGDQIGRYLDFQNDYVTGKVTNIKNQTTAYFLERRRPEKIFQTRYPDPNIKIEYPFLVDQKNQNDTQN